MIRKMTEGNSADISTLFPALIRQIVEFPLGDKVVDFLPPQILEKELEEKLENLSGNLEEIAPTTEFILSKCLNTSHRFFLNQLYGGVHPMGLAGAYIVEKMNTNQ